MASAPISYPFCLFYVSKQHFSDIYDEIRKACSARELSEGR